MFFTALRAAALFLLVIMPARATEQGPAWMVGTWFGHGQPGDPASMYIDRMKADGEWRGEYRSCRHGKAVDLIQTGRWRMDGDTLILKVESVGGLSQQRTDLYRMLAHDMKAQRYVSLPLNFAYSPKRASETFEMPSCELIS